MVMILVFLYAELCCAGNLRATNEVCQIVIRQTLATLEVFPRNAITVAFTAELRHQGKDVHFAAARFLPLSPPGFMTMIFPRKAMLNG
jgi:hypothetical protein